MSEQHPITPPDGLVLQWIQGDGDEPFDDFYIRIATEAARWGADRELEACVEWMRGSITPFMPDQAADQLRAARRPKLKSRKQRALDALAQMEDQYLSAELAAEIRNALEELPDD